MKKLTSYIIVLVVLVIVFVTSAGSTLAAWSVQSDTVNKITIGSVKGLVMEEYIQNQTVMPGSTVNKVVTVKNTGDIDARIRVRIDKAWGASRDDDGNLIADHSLNTDNIRITYDSTKWYYDKADGYFYYLDVLSPGAATAVPLMKEFTVDKEIGNEYKNMQADIVVHMECVQAMGDGIRVWSDNPRVLGSYLPGPGKTAVAEVAFTGSTDGFTFKTSGGDLFVNFKDLIPGESQSQVIKISNVFSQKTEVFLRADFIDQTHATPENRELIEKLLKQYAVITITADDGTVIYKGPVWGNPDIDSHGTDSAKYFISLGRFDAGTSKNLTVSLSLDSAMDNRYQNLLGLVKWTFAAEGREAEYTPVTKTGERNQTILSLSLLLISGSLICILEVHRRRKDKKQTALSQT